MVKWLTLQKNMEWFPHPLHTSTRFVHSFSYGLTDVSIIMSLPPNSLAKIWEFSLN